jgi:hypothetical protein
MMHKQRRLVDRSIREKSGPGTGYSLAQLNERTIKDRGEKKRILPARGDGHNTNTA